MTFREFLISEDVISKFDKDELQTAKDIIQIIKKGNLQKHKVLFRGMNGVNDYIAEVTNNRSSFYGSLSKNTSEIIKKYLKVKNPTFATFNQTQALMFGKVYIFIPELSDTIYLNKEVRDIMSETNSTEFDSDNAKKIFASEYKDYNISNIPNAKNEVIVDSEKYYLVNYTGLSGMKLSESITYNDVLSALENYLNSEELKIKTGKRLSFDQQKKSLEKSKDKMAKLRQERKSPEQIAIRQKLMVDFLNKNNINFTEGKGTIEFKTQKAAKDAFKVIKKEIDSRQNKFKMMDLSKKYFINGELEKKIIKII